MIDNAIAEVLGKARRRLGTKQEHFERLFEEPALFKLLREIPDSVLERLMGMETPETAVVGITSRERNSQRDYWIAKALARDVMGEYEKGKRKNSIRAVIMAFLTISQVGPSLETHEVFDNEMIRRVFKWVLTGDEMFKISSAMVSIEDVSKYLVKATGLAEASPAHIKEALMVMKTES